MNKLWIQDSGAQAYLVDDNRTIHVLINKLKEIYNCFLKPFFEAVKNKYYLKFDGFYYKQNKAYCIIQYHGKRFAHIAPVAELVNDKNLISRLHPLDAMIIGIIANNENNRIKNDCAGLINAKKFRNPFLINRSSRNIFRTVAKRFEAQEEIITLQSKDQQKTITISIQELLKDDALVSSINPFDALAIGYDISDMLYRRKGKAENE
jgi:hypothetical protein